MDRELQRESKAKLSQLLGELAAYVNNYVTKGEQSLFTTRSRKILIKGVPYRSTVFAKVRAINRHGVGDRSAIVSLCVG